MQISTGVSLKLSQEENWRKGKRIKMFAWQNRITSLWRDHDKNDRSISVNLIYTPYRNTLNLLITLYHYFRNRRDIGFNRQRLLIRAHICIGLENNFKKRCIFIISPIWPRSKTGTTAPEAMKFTFLVYSTLVIVNVGLVWLIFVREGIRQFKKR